MNNNTGKRIILIADDDDDARAMLTFIFEEENWEVKQAKNGKEALEKVIQEQPDLLILDNRMPELAGSQVYQQLQVEGIKLPVVFATAYSDLEELAAELGISFFISKPYDIPELLKTVESAYESSVAENE